MPIPTDEELDARRRLLEALGRLTSGGLGQAGLSIPSDIAEKDLDDNRNDIYLCFACTLDTPQTMHKTAIIYHAWDNLTPRIIEQQPDCEPYWGRNVTIGFQKALFDYELALHRIETPYMDIDKFNSRRNGERVTGLRELEDVPHPKAGSTSFATIAKHTDRTGHGMFPEEVMDWVIQLRKNMELPFPEAFQETPLFAKSSESLSEAMCEGELLHFASWLNSQHLGAGSVFVAGPLLPALIERGVTEEFVESAWDRVQVLGDLLRMLGGGPPDA